MCGVSSHLSCVSCQSCIPGRMLALLAVCLSGAVPCPTGVCPAVLGPPCSLPLLCFPSARLPVQLLAGSEVVPC